MDQSDHHSFVSLLTVMCLVTFGSYFAVSMRLPVVPLYARGFGVTTTEIGVINLPFVAIFAWTMLGYTRKPDGIGSL